MRRGEYISYLGPKGLNLTHISFDLPQWYTFLQVKEIRAAYILASELSRDQQDWNKSEVPTIRTGDMKHEINEGRKRLDRKEKKKRYVEG